MVCSLLDFLIQMGICLSSCFTFYFHFCLSLFVLFSHKSKIRNRVDLFFCNHATYSHHLYHLNFIPFPSYPFPLFLIFSCPEQLNRWPCHSLTHSLLLLPYKEQSLRLATIETFDQTDFWKVFRFLEDFQFSGTFLKDFQIFGRFSDFWKIFRFVEDFYIFGRFAGFWTIQGLVTFETLITILTIENLNSSQSLLSDN